MLPSAPLLIVRMPPAQETTAATAVVVETAAPGPTPLKEKTASDSAVEPQEAQPAKPSKGKAKRFTAPVKKAAETEAAGAVLESSADTKYVTIVSAGK